MFRATPLGALALVLLAAGCASHPPGRVAQGHSHRHASSGGGYYQNDGPPLDGGKIDLAKIPNAVPKNVPPSKFGNPPSYTALGKTYYVLKSAAGFSETGMASWYGREFNGERTSSGAPYNMFAMTAAQKTLPIPSWVRVTNLDNGRHVIVKINDRGPFLDGRIIDLSYVAALKLGVVATGSAPVRVQIVTPADYRNESPNPVPVAVPQAPLRAAANPNPPTPPAELARSQGNREQQIAHRAQTAAPRSPTSNEDANGPMLQVGAFSHHENAIHLRQHLAQTGFRSIVVVAPTRDLPFYLVQLGPFSSIAQRDAVARRLIAHGYVVRSVKR